ncbi:MAG: asparaginase [Flavobacteriaceae bacterium]|jgi:L-asparaginase|nr:asparaginase [Flavobacteriaceae bacterium]
MKRKILMIYTGGTIGMMKKYGSDTLIPFDFNNIFDQIPEINLIDVEIEFFKFKKPIDSSDIDTSDWVELGTVIAENYSDYDGFVVLHGTDTMSYTASMLSFMLQGLQKPVIFTGSQLPIGELRTDAKENLITSLYYASLYQNHRAVITEVCLYFEFKLFRANRTTKFSAEHFDAFISPNYPILGEAGVNLGVFPEYLHKNQQEFNLEPMLDNRVDIFTFFPGKRKDLLDSAVSNPDLKGLILRTFGSGNIPSDDETLWIMRKAKDLGKELVVITQCMRGKVNFGKYQNSLIFREVGVINGQDMTVEAALAKLMWLLGKGLLHAELKQEFEKNMSGELTSK